MENVKRQKLSLIQTTYGRENLEVVLNAERARGLSPPSL